MSDQVQQAGLDRLADELYDLRCALDLADRGEPPFYTAEQRAKMRRRVAELEPLVGDHLTQLLAEEDAADAIVELGGTLDHRSYPPGYLADEREGWRE
jgi:hypothetical protein